MFPSILIYDFDLILGSFLTFWGPKGLFLGSGLGLKTVFGSTHAVETLSFSMFPSILTFDFDLILGSFFSFWSPNGLIFGSGRVQKLSGGLLI